MSEEAFEKEVQRNNNKIVTKEVSFNKVRVPKSYPKIAAKMEEKVYRFIESHRMSISNVALIDMPGTYQPYYYDLKAMYRIFRIPKRKGGYREICAPNEDLKKLQNELATMFTKYMRFLPHNAAHGFTKHRNCKTALEVHKSKGARWFLKIDIKDFFPNTSFVKLITAMCEVYPFCTLTAQQKWLFASVCTLDLCTPQGAPTSPVLTNMVMVQNDVEITKYCKEHGLTYTRYADDILISSPVHFDWQTVQQDIASILTDYELKTEKTRYGNFNGRNWNLGLMYNNKNQITVGHAKKKLIKNLVHNYKTKPETRTQENWHYLMGTIGYCYYIEPDYFKDYLEYIKNNPPA